MTNPPGLTGVAAAVAALDDIGIKGTRALLARRIGVTRAAVADWDKIPLARLAKVVEVTGLPPEILRPTYREDFARELGIKPEAFLGLGDKPGRRRAARAKPARAA